MNMSFWASPKGSAILVGSIASVSFFSGGALSYLLTKRSLETKYTQIAEKEIEEAKSYYKKVYKADEFSNPKQLALDITNQIIKNQGYSGEEIEPLEEEASNVELQAELIRRNIFDPNDTPGWDWEEELGRRSEDDPYIIHHDEYMQNEKDYEQITLTYFEGDDVLCNEEDEIFDDIDILVGGENLTRFGHGSKDNNIVYVRCDHIQTDWEIVRRKGNYAQEVLGFIEHSEDSRRPRKFRRDYE